MNRSLILIHFLATLVCLASALRGNDNEGNDYTWGTKAATSTLIAQETISKNKMIFQTTTKTYTLTQAGTTPKTIEYIKITDLKRMRGATAEITDGGVGATTVTVKFTSAKGSGIKSQIEIWGA
ncbi:uncharacterized protein LOC117783549 [Drosophila innubila]|uniref:uncharacterized protein LOC117783549 n=1 Tax=Drosophila innubila TaxID=198719 RepID=UPI00148C294D|nr:uncharacterized protein LOC117783549 [Drosophila innubila]